MCYNIHEVRISHVECKLLFLEKVVGNNGFFICGINRFKILEKICNENEWSIKIQKNHSKVFLFNTEHGRFVLETSSNLNKNPKIEQFSFEKDSELYEFYKMNLFDENEEESGEDI